MFDVLGFLLRHNIPYITHGVNVKRGEININCPFCARTTTPDPSFHCGIDVERGRFSCWRNRRQHVGRTLHRLIMALTGGSYAEACRVLGDTPIWLRAGAWERLLDDPEPTQPPEPLVFPPDIEPIDLKSFRCRRFAAYLADDRGFFPRSVPKIVNWYRLHCAVAGRYKDRVVIPNHVGGRLVNWTARSIYSGASVRYLSLDATRGAWMSIKDCVFNADALLAGGSVLVVVEGPFDAMKLDCYGAAVGVRATCLFNKKVTMAQVGFLSELANVFQKIVVLLDVGEELDQMDFLGQLSWLPRGSVEEWSCPSHVKDPGELAPRAARALCVDMVEKLC